uniref:Uncharacterized protein n=1 Tax=Rhizophora mucronata TaxID=61149 RepID=A0A2P2PT38_RHIMU
MIYQFIYFGLNE